MQKAGGKMEVIQMKDVSFHYTGDVPILENVNICLNSGDYAILTGENGSGKSTFLKLLLGELEPDQGTVEIFGKKIGKADFKELKIGYVPQNSISGNKDFPATIEEVMMTGLYRPFKKRLSRKACRQKITVALTELGMESFLKRRIGELSGGQQQRVMLARVLAADPGLLILDEPTVGVDSVSLEALAKVLQKKNEEGLTILMVTHGNTKLFCRVNRHFKADEGGITE